MFWDEPSRYRNYTTSRECSDKEDSSQNQSQSDSASKQEHDENTLHNQVIAMKPEKVKPLKIAPRHTKLMEPKDRPLEKQRSLLANMIKDPAWRDFFLACP